MSAVVSARGLGKRYRRSWALRDCTLEIPRGRVTGLVGRNGAGKTTLLSLVVGMITPTTGTIEVCGGTPAVDSEQLARVGFAAQDTPTYAGLTVAEHLRLGAHLNPRWDEAAASRRIDRLGLDPRQRAGRLSGGQRAQLALTIGLARRPSCSFSTSRSPVWTRWRGASSSRSSWRRWPRTRSACCCRPTSSPTSNGSVTTSSFSSTLRCAWPERSTSCSRRTIRLSGPRRDPDSLPADQHVVWASHTDRQSTYVIRTDAPLLDPSWTTSALGLEDLVLAYMGDASAAAPVRLEVIR